MYLLSSDWEYILSTVSKMVAKVTEVMAGTLIIPTVYVVYRGIFRFCFFSEDVSLFVCLSVCKLVSVKDFSGSI